MINCSNSYETKIPSFDTATQFIIHIILKFLFLNFRNYVQCRITPDFQNISRGNLGKDKARISVLVSVATVDGVYRPSPNFKNSSSSHFVPNDAW